MAKKYQKGSPLHSLDEIAKQEFVYIRDKIYHHGWFMSAQISYMKRCMEDGFVFKAERVSEDGK